MNERNLPAIISANPQRMNHKISVVNKIISSKKIKITYDPGSASSIVNAALVTFFQGEENVELNALSSGSTGKNSSVDLKRVWLENGGDYIFPHVISYLDSHSIRKEYPEDVKGLEKSITNLGRSMEGNQSLKEIHRLFYRNHPNEQDRTFLNQLIRGGIEFNENLKHKEKNLDLGFEEQQKIDNIINSGARLGYYLVRAGNSSFTEWANKMVEIAGENIEPFLEDIWNYGQIPATLQPEMPLLKEYAQQKHVEGKLE